MEANKLDFYKLSHTGIESVFKVYALDTDITFLDSLRPLGYDYNVPKKEYPYQVYLAVLRAVVNRCWAAQATTEACRELGRAMFKGLEKTFIGQVALSALPVVRPTRVFSLVIQGMNRDASFGRREVVQLGPRYYRLDFEDDPGNHDEGFMRLVTLGFFEQLAQTLRISQPELQANPTGPFSYSIEISWQTED